MSRPAERRSARNLSCQRKDVAVANETAKTWLITGVSRGIGAEVAARALARGDRVAGTVRKATNLSTMMLAERIAVEIQ